MEALNFCVIVPAYGESGRIGKVVEEIRRFCPAVVVIDDGSPDGTAEEAGRAGAFVIKHARNMGKGEALKTGFRHALENGYSFVVTMDADGQHDPADIPGFTRSFRESGAQVIVGDRMSNAAGMPFVRRMTNRFMSRLLSREMGQRVPDTQCGYRLYGREVLPMLIDTGSARFAAESEVLLELALRGAKIGSAPVRVIYGDERSKINPVLDTLRFFGMIHRFRNRKREK